MVWYLVIGMLIVLLAAFVGAVSQETPMYEAKREIRLAHKSVDKVFAQAHADMEAVARQYRQRNRRGLAGYESQYNFSNWQEWLCGTA